MKKLSDLWRYCVQKIPCFVLFFVFLFTGIQAYAAPDDKISLKVSEASVREVLDLLKKQNYRLVYTSTEINACPKKVTFDLKNVPLSTVLSKTFDGTSFAFSVEGNVITIRYINGNDYMTARGTVSDERGEPLPGVAVFVKGAQYGTTTTNDGEFQIRITKNTRLVFSFVGMKSEELTIVNDKPVRVTLKVISSDLDEAVIIGYGAPIDRNKLTSSVVSIKGEDVIEAVGNKLDQMLQGKIPGMTVMQQTSTVGAAPKIRIRGSSSIMGNREPVWVLDGVVLENPVKLDAAELNSMDKVNLVGNAISGLNPEDIERIDVLKDASATAIYGVKAANGVIVITTKRGKQGPPAISYSTSMSIVGSPRIQDMHVMNSQQRIEVSEEMQRRGLAYVESGSYTPTGVGYESALQGLWDNKINLPEFYAQVKKMKDLNTNWFDLLFRKSFSQSHTLSISGASETVSYYFSAGYSKQQGAVLEEKSERYNFMSNMDFHPSKRFRATVSLAASIGQGERAHSSIDMMSYAFNTSRAIPVFNEDGSYAFYDRARAFHGTPNLPYNILHELDATGSTDENRNVNTNISLDYRFADWLSLNAVLSYNTGINTQESYADEDSYYVSTLRETVYGYKFVKGSKAENEWKEKFCALPYGGVLENEYSRNNSYTARASLSFNKDLGHHNLSAFGGIDLHSSAYKGNEHITYGYMRDRGMSVTYINGRDFIFYNEQLENLRPTYTDSKENTMSYFGSASYIYAGKYILNANIRGDASNKLGQDKDARFLPVWSVSGRWNVTDEPFMASVENILSSLSFRTSFGLQGNVTEAHNPYMVVKQGKFESSSEEYVSTLVSLPNPGLRWEKTRSFNVGVDFSLFKGALSGTFEYYSKVGKDQLLSLAVSTTNGATSAIINGGDVHNRGWELSLSAVPVRSKNVTWSLNFNTSKNKNEIVNAGNTEYTYGSYLNGSVMRNGYAINSFYSYRFDRLNNQGLPQFFGIQDKDDKGNQLFKTKEEAIASALAYSGRREPLISGGLSSNLKFFDFSINFLFAVQLGNKIRLNDLYGDQFFLPYPQQNMQDEFVDRWKKPGDEERTNVPILTDGVKTLTYDGDSPMKQVCLNYLEMYDNSDLRVVSGDFLRCRSISLSYYLPKNILGRTFLKSASLGIGVTNPFVIKSKALKGRDPEQVTFGSRTIPPQRNWSLSLSVTL